MPGIVALIFVYALVLALQAPAIHEGGGLRELVIYVFTMLLSFVLALLLLADVVIPSPTDGINHLLMKFAREFFQ